MISLRVFLSCALVYGLASAVFADAKTNKVGVMKFEVGEGIPVSLGKLLSETFTMQLLSSKQYTVVDWEEIDRVLGMEAKSQTAVSAEDARRMAMSKAGLEKLFLGRVDKLGSNYHVTVKLIGLDLRVERVEQSVAENEGKLPEAVKQVAAALLVDNSDEAIEQRAATKAAAEAEARRKEDKRLTDEKRKADAAAKAEDERRKANPAHANRDRPWTNSLGQIFVPVPDTKVLFCIWDTRVQDFEVFASATGHDATAGMYSVGSDRWKQRGATWKSPGFSQGPTHPVCGVSWEDAQAFCRWLTERERGEGRLGSNQSYRLPTDAEWSVAVGLGQESGATPKDKDGKTKGVYPWGGQWPPPSGAGNYAGSEAADSQWPSDWKTIEGYQDGYPRTSPAGRFRANSLGLFDMGGNVWQWCEDWYDGEQKHRVLRGASWLDNFPDRLLSSYRRNLTPGGRYGFIGFRCVLGVGSSP
jgi:hypothetical protein